MNKKGQADYQVLCWWKIWLLSTSAFLNKQLSPLSPGGEVISFFFSPLHHHPVLSSFQLSPSALAFSPTSFICSSPPLLYASTFSCFFFIPSAFPCSLLHPSPFHSFLPPLRLVSGALAGTAHSATKQSCLQHHILTNQARLERSSPRIHSIPSRYRAGV